MFPVSIPLRSRQQVAPASLTKLFVIAIVTGYVFPFELGDFKLPVLVTMPANMQAAFNAPHVPNVQPNPDPSPSDN